MADALRHRGPDEGGAYVDPHGRTAFGFRRLSIIDVAHSHQPLSNENGTVWLEFNGEIYNFAALRAELLERGHTFRTAGDTETIVHAWEEWGADCFARFAGMFAIALWDQRSGELILARDRFGKKPLCYAISHERLLFASELKALVAAGAPRDVDPHALANYLLFQYVPAPQCIYQGWGKLPPGHYWRIKAGAAPTSAPQAYWTPPEPPATRSVMPYADALDALDGRLESAVAQRLISDVPLGAFLSGGLDSSIVVGLMRRLDVRPLRTFSIGFPDRRYDETRFAREVAERFETEHRELIVTPDALQIMDDLAWSYDEPFADSSAIPTLLLSRWTRESVTVALTGDGGDELFGGYDRYRAANLAGRLDWLPRRARALLGWVGAALPSGSAKSHSRRLNRFLTAIADTPAGRYRAWAQVFSPAMLKMGLRPPYREMMGVDAATSAFDAIFQTASGTAAERAMRVDMQTYLPGDLLVKVDIASMAASLECRAPLLDHQLAAFAAGLPSRWRMGKRILRDWARRPFRDGAPFLPASILERRKMGFGVPIGSWFRNELRGLLGETLLAEDGYTTRVFERAFVERLIGDHQCGRAEHAHPLWALLMFEKWARRWAPSLPA